MKEKDLLQCIDVGAAKEYLKDMIRINSVTGNEAELADYIAEKLKGFGFDSVKKQIVDKDRYNVIAELCGGKPGNTILLTGHMDTVSAGEGWLTDPFEPVEKDGRIYGRGSNDMKAGIAVVLSVVKIAAENRDMLPGKIVVAFVSDEEAYSAGVIALTKEGIKADFGISAEPEYESMIVGAAGKILIRVEVSGLSAHGATPHLGINAVEDAGRFLAGLETIKLKTDSKMGSQPYVALRTEGGFKEYGIVVPDHCSLIINKHTVPGETKESVLEALKALVEDLKLRSGFEFIIERPFYPSYEVDENNIYVNKLRMYYKEVTGKELGIAYGDGVSDNNYLVPEGGIPTVCLGPGGGNIHSCNEWVSIEQMEHIQKIYLMFLFN